MNILKTTERYTLNCFNLLILERKREDLLFYLFMH